MAFFCIPLMIRNVLLIGALLLALIGSGSDLRYERSNCVGDYAPGVVLVGLHTHPLSQEKDTWQEDPRVFATPKTEIRAIHVPVGQECIALEELRREPNVAFAELDYAVRATDFRFLPEIGSLIPNDPAWPSQWGPTKINAPDAWDVTTGTPETVIAILDTGVQLNHEDVRDNLWTNADEVPGNEVDDDANGKVDDIYGWHFYHKWDGEEFVPGEDSNVADDHGHGTHVAGIAGARINNGVGIAGMAGNSQLMVVKVMDSNGDGWYSDLAQGIIYAVDNGARVINLSLGGTPPSQTLQEAVNYAHERGVLLVAASGNTGGAVLYPAACEHVLAVAATGQDDTAWYRSNHGPQVDVAAPGVSIYSTGWTGECASGYCRKSGTSMATPHVSGLAALAWSARPDLTAMQVTEIITATTLDVNKDAYPGRDEYLGWGRIDAGRALSRTMRGEVLYLEASRSQLPVGETALITATAISSNGTADWLVFAASGGAVSPTMTALSAGTATTLLRAGPVAGKAVVTGTTGVLTSTLTLELLPGPITAATLTPSAWEARPGNLVALTLTARDDFGNPPLDGLPVGWVATGGAITSPQSRFLGGVSNATFTAGDISTTAMITARVNPTITAGISLAVIPLPPRCYLPLVLQR